jgi:hypothetical protein
MSHQAPCALTDLDHLAIAIDHHVTATSTCLARTLAATIDTLGEPRVRDPVLARQRLELLVETLAGVAVGAVVGRVVHVVLRSAGASLDRQLEHRLREALRQFEPSRRAARRASFASAPSGAHRVCANPAAPRLLVDQLVGRLHARLASTRHEHRAALISVAAAVPPSFTVAFTSALAQLDDETALASLWSEHLAMGWRYYAFSLTDECDREPELPPELAHGLAHSTWRAWLVRVRREPRPTPPLTDDFRLAITA